MTPAPRPDRPSPLPRSRRPHTGRPGRWRRMRRPVLHGVVAALQLPVLLLVTSGHATLVVLLLSAAAGAGLAVAVVRRRRYLQRRAEHTAAQQHAEQVLAEIYDEWLGAEALRGQQALERWRRTHRL